MATLATMNTPTRQPFGVLDNSKLRSLQSMKNRQNAITPNSAPSLKRRAPSPEWSDSENIDPNILDSHGKRKKAAADEDVSLSKPSRYSIHVMPASKPRPAAPVMTPRLDVLQRPTTTPVSAPPAAGRSPTKGKRMGLLQPRKRFAPPSFKTKSPSLSITAALNGTLAHKKTKKPRTIEETKPTSWFFDIFEESQEQQDYRMNEWTMTQSAVILDISDDESKMKEESDKGKENVDPNEVSSGSVTRSSSTSSGSGTKTSAPKISRKDAMLDEPRKPLGDLNPSEFYGEGLDATSVILVHDETETAVESEQPQPQPQTTDPNPESLASVNASDFTFEAREQLSAPASASATGTNVPESVEDIHALLAASAPVWDMQSPHTSFCSESTSTEDSNSLLPLAQTDASAPIEIWESESAKDENEQENEKENADVHIDVDVSLDEAAVFALQEL